MSIYRAIYAVEQVISITVYCMPVTGTQQHHSMFFGGLKSPSLLAFSGVNLYLYYAITEMILHRSLFREDHRHILYDVCKLRGCGEKFLHSMSGHKLLQRCPPSNYCWRM